MITITRLLVRQLRSVYRRAGIKPSNHRKIYLAIQAGAAGLFIRAKSTDIVVEYHQPGELAAEQLVVPLDFLADCEGSKNDLITLEARGEDKIVATWTDRSIPQLIEYQSAASKDVPVFPDPPETLTENEPGLWKALHEASQVTDESSGRYALGYIQLRASDGRVAAMDGRQIYMQTGFQFPWQNEVLVLGSSLFASRELPQDQPVRVGQFGDWVTLALGPWTFRFCQPKAAKFPKLDDIIKGAEPPTSRLHIPPTDAKFLIESLPRLPSSDSRHEPITLDLNGKVVVRSRSAIDGPPTDLIANNSHLVGDAMMLDTNRKFLLQALRLGFQEIGFKNPNSPALCIDGNRRYLWALLEPEGVIRPSDNAVRIESPIDTGNHRIPIHPIPRRTSAVSNTNTIHESTAPAAENATATRATIHRPKQDEHASPIEQVVVLRNKLRETVSQANELIRSLKRQKKQSRLVASTLASLKELQKVAG